MIKRSGLGLLIALACVSCTSAPPKDARAFLLWSMDQHKGLKSYSAKCVWTMDGGPGFKDSATRTLSYVAPNRFLVVTSRTAMTQTSVSDGTKLVEYSTIGTPGDSDDAPKSLADAKSPQMQHPMFCGSLLYQFFGGGSNISSLADESQEKITGGAEENLPGGGKGRLINFYGTATYGHVQALIDEKTGMVDQIRYDSDGLLKKMKAMGQDIGVQKFDTTETYSDIQVNPSLQASIFIPQPPTGTQLRDVSASATPKPPVAIGQPAPDFTVKGLDGKDVKLSSLRGKPVLLDFWATWCGPCRMSLPHTQKVAAEHGNEITVLSISNETADKISAFIKDNKYTFAPYRDTDDSAGFIYNVQTVPTFVVIDAKGNLVDYQSGYGGDGPLNDALAKVGIRV